VGLLQPRLWSCSSTAAYVNLVLSFLLVPSLTDATIAPARPPDRRRRQAKPSRLIAHFSRIAIRLQVAVLYLHAAFAAAVTEWQNGTALYYWLADRVRRSTLQLGLALLVCRIVAPMTWSVMALEFAVCGPAAKREHCPILLATAGLRGHRCCTTGQAARDVRALILFLRP
jgi:hypothetical protein